MKRVKNLIFLWAVLLVNTIGFYIKDRKFYDDSGRELRFRGPNVVVKVPPYMPHTDKFDPVWSFSTRDMQNCQRWGFNAIRLGMMWAGVEPTPDKYNQTYLDEMEKLINKAGQYGIYTLIDFHQDLISEKFCGDGVPTWLMDELHSYKTFPFPVGKRIHLNASDLPSWTDCATDKWGEYYFSYDVGQTFNHLYHPHHRLNRKFTEFWKKVAGRFKNNKNVIAYELINEPFPGNVIRNPFLLLPSVAERENFQEFYDRLANQIRQVDPAARICFQPITFDQSVSAGFTHSPGGERFKNNSIFCYHYYNPPDISENTVDSRVKDAERMGVAAILDEFGQGGATVDEAEKFRQSWMFWGYKSFGKNWGSGSPVASILGYSQPQYMYHENGTLGAVSSTLTPTYMQHVAGTLRDESYNRETKYFRASYEAEPDKASILYLNKEWNYPKGFDVQLQPKNLLTFEEVQTNYLEIKYHGTETKLIQVVVTKL